MCNIEVEQFNPSKNFLGNGIMVDCLHLPQLILVDFQSVN